MKSSSGLDNNYSDDSTNDNERERSRERDDSSDQALAESIDHGQPELGGDINGGHYTQPLYTFKCPLCENTKPSNFKEDKLECDVHRKLMKLIE